MKRKKANKDIVNKNCVIGQIKQGKIALKKIEESVKNKNYKDILKEHVKNPKLKKIDLDEIRRLRKEAAIKREIVDNPLLADIKRKPTLKRTVKMTKMKSLWMSLLPKIIFISILM